MTSVTKRIRVPAGAAVDNESPTGDAAVRSTPLGPDNCPPDVIDSAHGPLSHRAPASVTLSLAQAQQVLQPRSSRGGQLLPGSADSIRLERRLADEAILSEPPPASNNPVVQYLAATHEKLAAEGLPTDATGVRVFVVGQAFLQPGRSLEITAHGRDVVRAIAGPTALATGADVRVMPVNTDDFGRYVSATLDGWTWPPSPREALQKKKVTLKSLGDLGARDLIKSVMESAYYVNSVRERVPSDGKTSLLCITMGDTVANTATLINDAVLTQAEADGSRVSALSEELLSRSLAFPDIDDVGAAGKRVIADEIRVALAREPWASQLETARQALSAEVRAARERGILVIKSSGNYLAVAKAYGVPSDATDNFMAAPGMLVVGAADIGDPDRDDDDRVANFSDPADVVQAGVHIDVGEGDEAGTSFSNPIMVSIAALMLKANPRLDPARIVAILENPRVARKLPGDDRDRFGIVDPVPAVRMARDQAGRSSH